MGLLGLHKTSFCKIESPAYTKRPFTVHHLSSWCNQNQSRDDFQSYKSFNFLRFSAFANGASTRM